MILQANTSQSDLISVKLSPIHSASIEKMTIEEVRVYLSQLSSLAISECNLDLVFGSNGSTGRGATGNYTLISRATGISRVHTGRVLSGKTDPSMRVIKLISHATGVGVGEISEYVRKKKEEREGEEIDDD